MSKKEVLMHIFDLGTEYIIYTDFTFTWLADGKGKWRIDGGKFEYQNKRSTVWASYNYRDFATVSKKLDDHLDRILLNEE